jgi:hypothetical protein
MERVESAINVSLIISDIEYTYASQLKTVNWTRDMWG